MIYITYSNVKLWVSKKKQIKCPKKTKTQVWTQANQITILILLQTLIFSIFAILEELKTHLIIWS